MVRCLMRLPKVRKIANAWARSQPPTSFSFDPALALQEVLEASRLPSSPKPARVPGVPPLLSPETGRLGAQPSTSWVFSASGNVCSSAPF